jgi:hypothetical protein
MPREMSISTTLDELSQHNQRTDGLLIEVHCQKRAEKLNFVGVNLYCMKACRARGAIYPGRRQEH